MTDLIPGLSTDQSGTLIDQMIAAAAAGGGVVTIPEGDFVFTQPIPAQQYVHVRGSSADAVRVHFEQLGDTDYGFDFVPPAGGSPPLTDRRYSGISNLTIDGSGLPSAGVASAVRIGNNHRSIDLIEKVRIANFGGDGLLLAQNNWQVTIRDLQVASCALRSAIAGGWRMANTVTDINFLEATNVQVEGCGNLNALAVYPAGASTKRYSYISPAINLTGAPGGTNRGWFMRGILAQGNYGTVQIYMENVHKIIMDLPYVEATAGCLVGVEMHNVTGRIGVPSLNATGPNGGQLVAPDKAFKVYGPSRLVIDQYVRDGGWATNDLEWYDSSLLTLIAPDPALVKKQYGTNAIQSFGG